MTLPCFILPWILAGRTVRVGAVEDHFSFLLKLAVEVGFDWVLYASDDYIRLSVIPDGKYSHMHPFNYFSLAEKEEMGLHGNEVTNIMCQLLLDTRIQLWN